MQWRCNERNQNETVFDTFPIGTSRLVEKLIWNLEVVERLLVRHDFDTSVGYDKVFLSKVNSITMIPHMIVFIFHDPVNRPDPVEFETALAIDIWEGKNVSSRRTSSGTMPGLSLRAGFASPGFFVLRSRTCTSFPPPPLHRSCAPSANVEDGRPLTRTSAICCEIRSLRVEYAFYLIVSNIAHSRAKWGGLLWRSRF